VSGFPNIATNGINSSGHAAFSSSTPASGVAFTPNASFDTFINVNMVATTVGTLTVTYGPSTGAENTWCPSTNLVVASGANVGLYVPAGWKVVVTTTGVTTSFSVSIHRI
jgi:hypothetical protein